MIELSDKQRFIRPYKPEDKEFLLAIFDRNTPKYFSPDERAHLDGYLDLFGETYLCLVVGGSVVGGAGYQFSEDHRVGSITWIFIEPSLFGKNLGRDLMETAEAILKKDPIVQILRVRTSQLVSPFFSRLGFVIKDSKKDYWASGFDLVVVEKPI